MTNSLFCDGYGECFVLYDACESYCVVKVSESTVEVGRVCVTGLIGSSFRCDVSLR